jgi:hypothetical protein
MTGAILGETAACSAPGNAGSFAPERATAPEVEGRLDPSSPVSAAAVAPLSSAELASADIT